MEKCCFLLLGIFSLSLVNAQNVIKVKKETPVETFSSKGIYYSDPFTFSSGQANQPPTDFQRMYLYIDDYDKVYIFHSAQKVKKVVEKFLKEPKKWIEETGQIEFVEGTVYIKTQGQYHYNEVYRYTGELVSKNSLYLDYKATPKGKRALNIKLYRYIK